MDTFGNDTLEEDEQWMSHLHFVRSDIDPATVKPIDPRQLASLVNEFLLRSADILNKFCAQFENRMMELDIRLDTFERMLALLERKLENIQIDQVKTPSDELRKMTEGVEEKAQKPEETPEATESKKQKDQREEKGTPEGTLKAKEHPKVAKYFKMLKMGVPEAAVRQKMKSEEVDDALLDDPEKPLALAAHKSAKQIDGRNPSSHEERDESSSSTSEE